MEADWRFGDGVETLVNQINTGLRYATHTRNSVNDQETVNIAMQIALKSGLFIEAYSTWHAGQPVEQTG